MRKWVATAALVIAASSAAYAGDVKSGLAKDDAVAAFNVNDVTGPRAGDTLCYRCQYGARPVVTIFTRKIDENLTSLIKDIDGQVAKNEKAQMKAFVVLLTDDTEKAEKELKAVAEKAGIKNVPLTTFDGKVGPPEYKLNEKAETTVLMWNKSKVKVNEGFEAGKFDKAAVSKVAALTSEILN
ncbi:MAG: hypothetical protein IT428_10335 [Planctomycetaceae bacterium]|nr:hypothetical protein [Planctomycetaceae bacterium]